MNIGIVVGIEGKEWCEDAMTGDRQSFSQEICSIF